MCCTSFLSAFPFIPLFLFLSQSRNLSVYLVNILICLSVCLSTIYQGSTLIHQKVPPPTEGQGLPVLSFIALEQFNAIRLVQVCKITSALTNSKH